jgi:ribose transport system permease protein
MGTLIALYLLAIISFGLELLGASAWVQDVFNGAALLIALGFSRITRRRGSELDDSGGLT